MAQDNLGRHQAEVDGNTVDDLVAVGIDCRRDRERDQGQRNGEQAARQQEGKQVHDGSPFLGKAPNGHGEKRRHK